MSKIEEPLEKGWLGTVLRDVRKEVATWPANSSFPKPIRDDSRGDSAPKSASAAPVLETE
jgi:hypothetical protein